MPSRISRLFHPVLGKLKEKKAKWMGEEKKKTFCLFSHSTNTNKHAYMARGALRKKERRLQYKAEVYVHPRSDTASHDD